MTVTLKSRLPQIAREIQPKVSIATHAGAKLIEEAAKSRVSVSTGRLRDSIRVEDNGGADWAVRAGNRDAFYGLFIEFGTTRRAARPFFVPAAEERKAAVTSAVSKALKTL